jgi:hypothetical protein
MLNIKSNRLEYICAYLRILAAYDDFMKMRNPRREQITVTITGDEDGNLHAEHVKGDNNEILDRIGALSRIPVL